MRHDASISRNYSAVINRRLAFPILAFLAVLAVGLLFLLPGGPLHAQEAMTEWEYAENGTDPVVTFTAVDPEERTVYWSLPATPPTPVPDGFVAADFTDSDAADFKISMDGVLDFKAPPDYETPMGGGTSATATNTYNIVVASSDDALGAGTSDMPIRVSYYKLTVLVTDVDEDGSISLSALQPQVGVSLIAMLTDQDARSVLANPIINSTWKWEQAPAMDGPWTLIPGAGMSTAATDSVKASNAYTPVKATAGMYLRATVTYTDRYDDGDKTAMAVTAHMVRAKPVGQNSTPAFPDEDTSSTDVDVSRKVKENAPRGTLVGKPVVARDAGDILTYSLAGDDAAYFAIDQATGQITVKKKLNFEADANSEGQCTTTRNECQVEVTATDPWGITSADDGEVSATPQTVNITIEDVNEAPKVTGGPTRIKHPENEAAIDLDTGTADAQPPTYTATDPEIPGSIDCTNATCALSLEGPDAADFEIADGTADTTFGALSFKETPNFEKPADADKDNIYEVIVKVTDSGVDNRNKMSATRNVMITVTNANDDGVVTLSSVRPKVGIPFTASLKDDDGDVTDVTWKWASVDGSGGCPAAATEVAPGEWANIAGATEDTYTPKAADAAGTLCLQATATYADPHNLGQKARKVSDNTVIVNKDNRAPEFREGLDKPVMQATRSIEENSPDPDASPLKTSDVGDPVTATDPNADPEDASDAEGQLTYTLGGRDKDSFEIGLTDGQITVKAGTKLDYETKKSYMVTVTATDPSQASTTIDVTINVTNENEAPVIAGEDVKTDYAENGTGPVATRFTAKDPEGRTVYWSLGDDGTESPDEGDFQISSNGELRFRSAPNFDVPADSNTDNVYIVTVIASDDAPGADGEAESVSGQTSMKKATVTVTDKDEKGTLTITPLFPDTDDLALTANLADEDASSEQISAATYKWSVKGTKVDEVTGPTYSSTPATGNVRVEVTYSDGHGESKRLSADTTVIATVDPPPNTDPEFTDGATTGREVSENRHPATVGSQVRATDSDRLHIGKLEYSIPSDNPNFTIDRTAGQLRTKRALDHETATTEDGTESVTVTVIDPAGGSDTIAVTIAIKDVNEAPTITGGPTMMTLDEDNVDTPTGDANSKMVGTYTAKDPESTENNDACNAASCTWSLRGTDASDLEISNEDTAFGALTFKEFPNYDMPVDSNKDNVYMVTVVLTDKGNTTTTRDVTVMVRDVEEEGVVTLSSVQPKVGIPFTASLEDDDGDVTDVTWQWASTAEASGACPAAATDAAPGEWANIAGATEDTYTPKAADADADMCLQATATYADRRKPGKSARGVSANEVAVNNDNAPPVFKKNDQEITETTRKVDEDAKPNTGTTAPEDTQGNVGGPVMAEDLNGDDLLTYTLGGPDAALFEITDDTIDNTAITRGGQISLNTNTKLDYETKKSYMVTVTATDPDGLSDSVDVTIKVTDVDEAPKIIVGGLVVTGTSAPDYPENGTGMVATYSAAGPDAAGATWDLSGADAGEFEISSAGVLTFMASPNYEMPMDANTDNNYMVMVKANDGTNDAMKTVSVRVTNEEEMGRVTFWRDGADATTAAIVVGDELGGAVDDSDGNPGDTLPIAMYTRIAGANIISWQWAKTTTPDMMDSWTNIGTGGMYTVIEGDNGYHLRATAMYDDGEGMGKMASMQTMMVTMNASPMFDSETGTREVAENTAAGMNIGGPVTATDADDDTLSYTLGGTDVASFDIGADGQLMTKAALDYETKGSYEVMVTATDPDSASDMITVTITVTNVDEPGEVTLWAGADLLTMAPQVGDTITGAVMDPDGGVTGETWQWAKTMTPDMMDSWMDITGETSAAYMVTADDTDHYLRVMTTYTDAVGTDMDMEYSMPTMMVTAAGDTLIDRYDVDGDGIEKTEVLKAINDYLFDEGDEPISRAEVLRLINLYLFG